MTFLLPLALLIGLTIAIPIVAHALRKGKSEPILFPAAKLVPPKTSSARKRHRLEDPLLLLLRVLLLACLALLAASPFVQCSRLSLGRTDGASVAAVIVVDDSASMRARVGAETTKLALALQTAEQLLDTARPGDSFAVVLAGAPARVLTPPTTELGSVRDALSTISESDRSTDISSALTLARSLQAESLQSDRPVVLLSDLAVADENSLDLRNVLVPQKDLSLPLQNCALVAATLGGDSVNVEVACTSEVALKGRTLLLEETDKKGERRALSKPTAARDGAVRIPLLKPEKTATEDAPSATDDPLEHWSVTLSAPPNEEQDQISADDTEPVLRTTTALTIAVRADQGRAGRKTGAGTVLQAALESLDQKVRVHALNLLPDRAQALSKWSAVLIDDPSGFSPEVSDALRSWVSEGGVAVAFLGPSVSRTPLGSSFHPFLTGAPSWEKTDVSGTDPLVEGTLGPLTQTWAEIGAKHRVVFGDEPGALIKAAFKDGKPLVTERLLGRGLLLTVTLPSSTDESDLALRPAFLELLDYVTTQSALRRGAFATTVGEAWRVSPNAVVTDPEGNVLLKHTSEDQQASVEPPIAGKYTIKDTGAEGEPTTQVRYALRDAPEHITQPLEKDGLGGSHNGSSSLAKVGISRELALICLVLGLMELIFRLIRRPIHSRVLQERES